MPKRKNPPPSTIGYQELRFATGLNQTDYAELMRVGRSTVLNRELQELTRDPYTELALLHAGAHPFFKLIKR